MKPIDILAQLPEWSGATRESLLASPALSVPCRVGDTPCFLRTDAPRLADALALDVKLGDEDVVLELADNPALRELHAVWEVRADMPSAILLALVERECGPLLQALENALRRQLRIAGIAAEPKEPSIAARLVAETGETLATFGLTRSPGVTDALGQLRNIDLSNPLVRDRELRAEVQYAAFALDAADLAALAPGDALLLPELDPAAAAWPASVIAEGRIVAAEGVGVTPWTDDGLLRVVSAEPCVVTFGALADLASDPSSWASLEPFASIRSPAASASLKLVKGGRTIASGRLERLGDANAMAVDALS